MLTVINRIDMTSYIPYESIDISQTAGDPIGKATLQVIDPGAQLSLQPLQEVIFLDETVALTPNTAAIPAPFSDSFASNDISNYTSAYNPVPPGSLASWIISGGVLTASGGAYALLTLNNWLATNVTVSATMTQSDFGGIVFNVADTQNYYEIAVRDASSPGAGLFYASRGFNSTLLIRGSIQLYKTVNGIRSALGASVPIPFVRGTSHVIAVRTAKNGTAMQISVSFDGVQVLAYVDSSGALGQGSVGLRNDTVSGVSSAIYDAFSATSNDLPPLTTSVPTHNYLNNNNFNYGSGGWAESGTLTGRFAFPSSGTFGAGAVATLSFANQAIGTDSWYQNNTGAGAMALYIIAGQQYCFSGSINVTTPFTNSYAFIQLVFLDFAGNVLSTITSPNITTTSGVQRFSVSGAAPANAYNARAVIGGTTTNTTNSGTATFTALQVEPMWFPALYSYPSPICDFLQSDSVTLPNGTTARFDRVFTGYISHLSVSYEGTTRIWDLEVTSLSGMLEDLTLINATYSSATDQSIITGVINNTAPFWLFAATPSLYSGTPQALAYRNVPICYAGITLSNLQFADATPREMFNALADMTGFPFGVDAYYNAFYYPPFYNIAPYGFAGNGAQPDFVTTFPYYDYSLESDASQIQSAINVSGSTYPLTITETWHAQDGSHTEFVSGGQTFAFVPLHNPNQIAMTLVIGSTTYPCIPNPGTGGIGSPQAWVDEGYPLLQINPHVNAGTAISLTYTYNALVYVQVQSPDSIARFRRPLYSKINDTNLANNVQATTSGEAQLQAYAQPRITLKFKTTKLLSAGQIIEVTSTLDGLNKAHFAVQRVTASYLGDGINQYDIEAGVYIDDFVDFFRNSQKAINRADHDPAEAIKQYNNLQQDAVSYTDSLSIHP